MICVHTLILFLEVHLLYFFLAIFSLLNKDAIQKSTERIFLDALTKPHSKVILFAYASRVIKIKTLFEEQSPVVFAGIITPNVIFIYETITQEILFLANPFVWATFWFSLAINLRVTDQAYGYFYDLLMDQPQHPFSQGFAVYMKQQNPLIAGKGVASKLGKMAASAQTALVAGVFTCITGTSIAGMNVWYNERRDQRQVVKENVDRENANAQAQADRANANAQAAADRAHAAAQADAIRQAKASKRQEGYAENARAHERDREKWAQDRSRWAHEEKMKGSWWSP